jgi:GcrA cell cycle regulator
MPRDGAIIFSDLIGKLDVLRVECAKCGRSGRYRLADLITRYGRDEKLFAFTADVAANCTRKQARSDHDPCGAPRPAKGDVIATPTGVERRPKKCSSFAMILPFAALCLIPPGTMELCVMSPVWNAERLARLRELVAKDLSSSAIGAKLGFTRNAVCGARKRHGISPPQPTPEERSTSRLHAADRSGALRRGLPRSGPERSGRVRDAHPVGEDGVTLQQLEWWMCRWPVSQSDDVAMRFCGQPAAAGRSYCDQHAYRSRRGAA